MSSVSLRTLRNITVGMCILVCVFVRILIHVWAKNAHPLFNIHINMVHRLSTNTKDNNMHVCIMLQSQREDKGRLHNEELFFFIIFPASNYICMRTSTTLIYHPWQWESMGLCLRILSLRTLLQSQKCLF